MSTALVVGGFGALGSAVAEVLVEDGFDVLRSSRTERPDADAVVVADGLLPELPVLDAVVWAHGVNVNDTAGASPALPDVLDANVVSVARQLEQLIAAGRVADGARLVVLSSIWEQIARPGKFSYTVSKAAVGGLVRAAAMDLAPRGILVNAVLPGVVDTPMTRAMLSVEQQAGVAAATGAGRMVTPRDVAAVVAFLVSPRNGGVTGQSVVVDLGFSVGRVL